MRQTRAVAVLTLLFGLGLLSGCNRHKYSGEFCVSSDYPQTIEVRDWENFGSWSPGRGAIGGEGKKWTSFPWRDDFPDSAIVIRSEKGSDEKQQQEIDLRGVVPKGVEGTTHFKFGADGVWTVEFIEGDPF
ncbi:MAG: hypothetical protein WDZ51_14630 [Pirellulaceae bacterium]